MINTERYYNCYYGHPVSDLELVAKKLGADAKRIIWFAGDSSLDNKYWILTEEWKPAVNGYEDILRPPKMVQDVCYHMNRLSKERNLGWLTINTSVEATIVRQRQRKLLPQDLVIQSYSKENDVLIVSVGGNDVALYPTLSTIWSILRSVYYSEEDILAGKAPLSSLIELFREKVQTYITKLVNGKKLHKVIVCMIYYPDMASGSSWASLSLWLLRYGSHPERLQAIIRYAFLEATSKIKVEGVEIEPFGLFSVLDGRTTSDYVQRVEPSVSGGEKMARAFLDLIE